MDFLYANLPWVFLASFSGCLLLWPFFRRKNALTTEETVDLMNSKQALLVDIREIEGDLFVEQVPCARHLPLKKLLINDQLLRLHKGRPIVFLADNDKQAIKAVKFLKQKNFSNVFFVLGGINAWQMAGLPTKIEENYVKTS